MVRGRPNEPEPDPRYPVSEKIGRTLLELDKALRRIARCRRILRRMGYSDQRWLEIVRAVAPDMKFAARPQILDIIRVHLENAGRPMRRQRLVRELSAMGAGSAQQVRQHISFGLRNGKLLLFPPNKIGLPKRMRHRSA